MPEWRIAELRQGAWPISWPVLAQAFEPGFSSRQTLMSRIAGADLEVDAVAEGRG